jgi:TPR repeat protein
VAHTSQVSDRLGALVDLRDIVHKGIFIVVSVVCLLTMPCASARGIEEERVRAERGIASSQFTLGWHYQSGKEVIQDDAEAAKWYVMAAEQGHPSAQCNLGMMIMEGRGMARDKTAALNWFRKAARQGHPLAYYNLGTAYFKGDGVPRDYETAIKALARR